MIYIDVLHFGKTCYSSFTKVKF